MSEKVTMSMGSGGRDSDELVLKVFADTFDNEILNAMEDAALVSPDIGMGERLAITTDSFVVTPEFFRGGDIGRLSVCGTVNDLLMRGAVPKYITCGWIIETGAPIEKIKKAAVSMAEAAAEAGVIIVSGDTKVVDGDGGFFINTTGVGVVPGGRNISASGARPGDRIIVSGNLGDHHAAILSERMSIETDISSDAAPLVEMCEGISELNIHSMRDITRGGLGTVLKELALSSDAAFIINEKDIPVSDKVRDFCALLGLDPIYMGNEGKLALIISPEDADEALRIIKSSKYGENACVIGEVTEPDKKAGFETGCVYGRTSIGGIREIDKLMGEGLPRIC